MNISVCAIAENVVTSDRGQLSVINIIGNLSSVNVPFQFPRMFFVLVFSGFPDKDSRITGSLSHEDGDVVAAIPEIPISLDTMDVKYTGEIEGDLIHKVIIEMNNTPFNKFGIYKFRIDLNGQEFKSIPLIVRKVENATSGS